jgi:Leucine-rich repeat (LRR) protein
LPNVTLLTFVTINAIILFQIEDDSFEGLVALEYLDLSDNKLLSLPAAAIGRLPSLKRFKADYNRIGSINGKTSSENYINYRNFAPSV